MTELTPHPSVFLAKSVELPEKNMVDFCRNSLQPEPTRVPDRIVGTTRDISTRKRAEEELRQLSGRLLQLQDEERQRIARELHDSTGQNLVALATMLGQLRSSLPSVEPESAKLLSECKALAEQCIREVRTLSYVLHPPILDAGTRQANWRRLEIDSSSRGTVVRATI